MLRPMPIPTDGKAPRFTGKDIKGFLIDYDALCTQAGYTDNQKCTNFPRYCKKEVRDFVKYLDQVLNPGTFDDLKRVLKIYYGPSDHKKNYTRKSLKEFVRKPRKIYREAELNEYYRKFTEYSSYLLRKNLMAVRDQNDLFWRGIPEYLQDEALPLLRAIQGFDENTPYDYYETYILLKPLVRDD